MSAEDIIELKRSDLLSLLFEERFPYPQIRTLLFKGGSKVGLEAKTGSLLIDLPGKGWMTVERVEEELLKELK